MAKTTLRLLGGTKKFPALENVSRGARVWTCIQLVFKVVLILLLRLFCTMDPLIVVAERQFVMAMSKMASACLFPREKRALKVSESWDKEETPMKHTLLRLGIHFDYINR